MKLEAVVLAVATVIGVGGYFAVAALQESARYEPDFVIAPEPDKPPTVGLPNVFNPDEPGWATWEPLPYLPAALAGAAVVVFAFLRSRRSTRRRK